MYIREQRNSYNKLQSQQNIWNKVKKSSKIGQDYKILISDFAYFLRATAKNFWKGDWAMSPSNLRFFMSRSAFSEGNFYANFVKLEIKFRFSCGKWDLYQIISKFQNIMTEL